MFFSDKERENIFNRLLDMAKHNNKDIRILASQGLEMMFDMLAPEFVEQLCKEYYPVLDSTLVWLDCVNEIKNKNKSSLEVEQAVRDGWGLEV